MPELAIRCLAAAGLLLSLAIGCDRPGADEAGVFPAPIVPAQNPTTDASVELGRHLFYDPRLSGNQAIACASCHRQELAFADSQAVSPGATGELGTLNAPSLANAAYMVPLTWAHAGIDTLEDQLERPMFGTTPIEMDMRGHEDEIAERLEADPRYRELFAAAYPGAPIGPATAKLALASFVRSLVSDDSPFDAFLRGDPSALSDAARRGSELFYSQRLGCGGCHAGFALSVAARSQAATGPRISVFHNIGLYNLDGEGAYPESAPGLIAESGISRDMGRFRVPSLRNVAVTAPYMHDGSVASLEEVIEIYENGGRDAGADSPLRSELFPDFELTGEERSDLLAFLESLTDDGLLSDPRLSDPW